MQGSSVVDVVLYLDGLGPTVERGDVYRRSIARPDAQQFLASDF